MAENFIHLFLLKLEILSLGYPFFKSVVLMKFSSSVSLDLKQIIKVQWTRVLIRLILHFKGQNDPQHVYEQINVGF